MAINSKTPAVPAVPPIHILASCRNERLLHATTCVFKTLRVGFPTARVHVHMNGLAGMAYRIVLDACTEVGAVAEVDRYVDHWQWIRNLVGVMNSPFYLLDTDIFLWENCENWSWGDASMAGRYMPEFRAEYPPSITQPRLHTSFLYIDPVRLRADIQRYEATIPKSWFTTPPDLFAPQFVPMKLSVASQAEGYWPFGFYQTNNLFYDTCSFLYQIAKSQSFSEEQLDCYDHLHCGCSADIVGPHIAEGRMEEAHRLFCQFPERAKGIWKNQQRYLDERSPRNEYVDADA